MGKLKPCPFCGSEDIRVMAWEQKGRPFKKWRGEVTCKKCHATITSDFHSLPEGAKESIVEVWNKRTGGRAMIVYCDLMECKQNKDGKCNNRWPIGTEAISIKESYIGQPICSDFEEDEGQEDE